MDTAILKNFATNARSDLLKDVGARLDVVLAPGSNARAEQPGAVGALQAAVDREGRDAVVDRVAYTWFNRIIALRFMDANGYTAAGVISPEIGKATGQPHVLSDAKGGDFDDVVVNAKMQTAVTALLNGTRQSQDAQGEAYGLLLEAYCRYWNNAMPFMFEREGDYTELLMPTALLSPGSVRDRAVKTLTKDVCSEVEVIGWLYQFYISERKDEVFAGFKKNKKAGAAEIPAATQLFTPHWIVRYLVENSLGRLWLLNHPESRLAERMEYYVAPVDEDTAFLKVSKPEELAIIDPAVGSGHMLTYAFDLLYAIYEEEGYAPSDIPGLILKNNLYGTEIDPRAGALAAFALAMKATARRKTFLKNPVQPNICVLEPIHFELAELDYLWSLTNGARIARADADEFWNAFEHADTLGSLIQPDERLATLLEPIAGQLEASGNLLGMSARRVIEQAEVLSRRYAVAIANPPYMGSRRMADELAKLLETRFRVGAQDLYSAFILRLLELASPRGLVAMIAMQSWMFLSTFEGLRRQVLPKAPPTAVLHLAAGAFDSIGGAVVSTAAFILSAGRDPRLPAVFIDATQGSDEAGKSRILREEVKTPTIRSHRRSAVDLLALPGAVFGYWASQALVSAYESMPSLASLADARQGLSTANDGRFLRQWFEVSVDRSSLRAPSDPALRANARWVPCNKGGTGRRWYGNHEYVIDWANDGQVLRDPRTGASIRNANYYFQESVSWSNIGGVAAFRYFPAGFIFNAKGMSLFPHDPRRALDFLGYLNSSVAREAIQLVAPINSIEVGHVNTIPVPKFVTPPELIEEAVALAKLEWDSSELSWNFVGPEILGWGKGLLASQAATVSEVSRARTARIREIETENDALYRSVLGESATAGDLDFDSNETIATDTKHATTAAALGGGPEFSVQSLVSYAVGCMFGRYSLDEPGLILASQGETLEAYLAKVPSPSFMPDRDNVIPIVDDGWFEDDVVARFRQFLRVGFGDEHFEENLRFVTDSLGVKELRDYFVKSFYKNHVQRYKKRPIYWQFSSPKGSFNALIYMHRYTPSTASTVLNEYLREFIKKLEVRLEQQEFTVANGAEARESAAALKEADRLGRVLVELREYERDLYALASRQLLLDLDDGVFVNYQKFGAALQDIGLKKADSDE